MKKLEERLKAGINLSEKDAAYDEIVAEAETVLTKVLDAAEGKDEPYKNFRVVGGRDNENDREIIIVQGDGKDLLVIEVKEESIRVQPHGRHAVVLNEEDEAQVREVCDILKEMCKKGRGAAFCTEEHDDAEDFLFAMLKGVSESIGVKGVEDCEDPRELLELLQKAAESKTDKLMETLKEGARESRIQYTMRRLGCSRERAELIVDTITEGMER